MAGTAKESTAQYIWKTIRDDDFPVDSCKGWLDSCAYCDKRFCEWIPADDEGCDRIPQKPGFAMIALKSKNVTETVSILRDPIDIQKSAVDNIGKIRETTSNKKSKANKSVKLVRWMVVKRMDDKENSILCAHWRNSGSLPRFMTEWPGQTSMEECGAIVFSEAVEKWCYKQKIPIWRKPKPPVWMNTEPVESSCTSYWRNCDVCEYFTDWVPLLDVYDCKLAPSEDGLVLLGVEWGRGFNDSIDTLLLKYDLENIVMPINRAVYELVTSRINYLNGYEKKKAKLTVKWVLMKDTDSDKSCRLFAHFLNASEPPPYNTAKYPLPGERSLARNKNFVFRKEDKKWHHVREPAKILRFGKTKNRKEAKYRMELEDEDFFIN